MRSLVLRTEKMRGGGGENLRTLKRAMDRWGSREEDRSGSGWVLLPPNNTRWDEIGERGEEGVAIYVGGEGITVPWARGPWRFRSVREKSASSPPRNSQETASARVQRERGTEGGAAVETDAGAELSRSRRNQWRSGHGDVGTVCFSLGWWPLESDAVNAFEFFFFF